jgi:hypothetical protein
MQWTNGISYNGPPQFVVTGANSSVIQFIGVTPDRPDSLVVFGGSAENNWVPSGVSSPFTVDQGIAGLGAIAYGTFLGHVIQTSPVGAEPLVTMTGTGNINGIEFALLDALGEMRVSQDVVEVAWPGDTAGRVSQDVVEVAHDGATVGRLSQDVIETAFWTLGARVSQDCVEVAYSILDKVPPKGNNGHHGSPQGKKTFNTSNWIPWCEVNFFGGN